MHIQTQNEPIKKPRPDDTSFANIIKLAIKNSNAQHLNVSKSMKISREGAINTTSSTLNELYHNTTINLFGFDEIFM